MSPGAATFRVKSDIQDILHLELLICAIFERQLNAAAIPPADTEGGKNRLFLFISRHNRKTGDAGLTADYRRAACQIEQGMGFTHPGIEGACFQSTDIGKHYQAGHGNDCQHQQQFQ